MRFTAIVNAAGGTLRTIDTAYFAQHIETAFARAGHQVSIVMASGSDIVGAVNRIGTDPNVDGIIVAGGDGTLSLAASAAWKNGKLLATIPAGTMNFFARSLEIPADIFAAVDALADGEEKRVDIATANGLPFIHQFAAGLQPKMVRFRTSLPYRSRLGKIMASIRAALTAFRRSPRIKAEIYRDGTLLERGRYSLIAVSNNLYSAGHLPYPDRLDEGLLGLYTLPPLPFTTLIKLSFGLVKGSWMDNSDIRSESASNIEIRLIGSRRKMHAVIDGELLLFERRVDIRLFPKALRVLVPKGKSVGNSSASMPHT